jgi:hypothetical protein
LDAGSPSRETYYELSHGDHYIRCYYEVHLAREPGVAYGWEEAHSDTLQELTPEVCRENLESVADHILRSTKSCRDLDAGAYWGFELEPL